MFNFKSGSALAIQQDECKDILLRGDMPSNLIFKNLMDNQWIKIAAIMAPNNLVIRQWCLIDIISGIANNAEKILSMIDVLSYRNTININQATVAMRLWAEGYSYYEYTMDILKIWMNKFWNIGYMEELKNIISKIENGFIKSSYKRNDLWYPAPFGDLRDVPLRSDLQVDHKPETFNICTMSFQFYFDSFSDRLRYVIKASPIGLNTHVPKNDYQSTIIKGIPQNFKFYDGYDKKYSNKIAEILDTINWKRIIHI